MVFHLACSILLWLRKAYALLPRKFKKNLKEIFMLHPTKLLNVMSKVAKILGVSKKVFQKVRYPQTIAEVSLLFSPFSFQMLLDTPILN